MTTVRITTRPTFDPDDDTPVFVISVAAELADSEPDAVIVGCDSMLLMEGGEIVGKPGTPEIAAERWAQNAGTSGQLLTGHAIARLRDGGFASCHGRAVVHSGRSVRSCTDRRQWFSRS